MILKIRGKKQGGHVHARMFTGPHEGALAKNGDVVFREEEWNELRRSLKSGSEGMVVKIIEEDT